MHWLQNHWYRITPLHLILYPISMVFRVLVALRRALYRNLIFSSDRLLLPVIVIGNVCVGGTGKTPLTLALAQQLVERGWHPLIVSRGYGGKSHQPQSVSASSSTQQVGDEPLLMARREICPVWIGKNRAATAHAATQTNPQCDVVLCDDGLQHYQLQRDVEIAVIDSARGFGNGFLLPAGPLREPIARLQEVDAVVINGQARFPLMELLAIPLGRQTTPSKWLVIPNPLNGTTSHSTRLPETAAKSLVIPQAGNPHPNPLPEGEGSIALSPSGGKLDRGLGANESLREFVFAGGDTLPGQFAMHLSGELFYNLLDPAQTADAARFHATKNHAVAGIGNPQRYFQHLEKMDISFTPHAFPDHHPYSAGDFAFENCEAILLTEKDAVKCTAFADARYWVLRVDAKIDSTLIDLILRKIAPDGLQTA